MFSFPVSWKFELHSHPPRYTDALAPIATTMLTCVQRESMQKVAELYKVIPQGKFSTIQLYILKCLSWNYKKGHACLSKSSKETGFQV